MTCRTSSFCTVAWQLARFQLTRRIARSLGDSWAFCSYLQAYKPPRGQPSWRMSGRLGTRHPSNTLRIVDTEDEETAVTLSHVHTNIRQIWRTIAWRRAMQLQTMSARLSTEVPRWVVRPVADVAGAVNYVLLAEDFWIFLATTCQTMDDVRSLHLELTSWAYSAVNINRAHWRHFYSTRYRT